MQAHTQHRDTRIEKNNDSEFWIYFAYICNVYFNTFREGLHKMKTEICRGALSIELLGMCELFIFQFLRDFL